MSFSPPEETLSPKLSPMQVEAEDEAQRGSFDYSREPEYDGPEAPPVFVVLESDLASHEIRNSKSSNLKKINPIKNLPRMGASTIRTSKKFFEEKDPARLSRISGKLGRSTKERSKKKGSLEPTSGSTGDLLALEVSLADSASAPEASPREECDDSTPFFGGSEDEGELDPMLYSLELDEEMSPRNTHAALGKKFTSIRREAMRQSGRASNYLKQMPKTVSNSVEVTSQMLKEAVNTESHRSISAGETELPISRSPVDREASFPKVRKPRASRSGMDLAELQDAVAGIGLLQQNLPDILLSALETTRKQDCDSMQQFTKSQLLPLQEQNQILKDQLTQLNETHHNTQLLLESMTKKMEVLEQRVTAVQKSQVNQITLFDFIFFILNSLVLGFTAVMGWAGMNKRAGNKPHATPRVEVKHGEQEHALTLSEIVKKEESSNSA